MSCDGIAGDLVDLGGGVDLVDPVGLDQRACRDLAGTGLFTSGCGGEGEGRASAHSSSTREIMLASPSADGDADVAVSSGVRSRKRVIVTLSERDLAVETILMKSGLKGMDAIVDRLKILGRVKVVVTDDKAILKVAKRLQLGLLQCSADSELEVGGPGGWLRRPW